MDDNNTPLQRQKYNSIKTKIQFDNLVKVEMELNNKAEERRCELN